VKKQKYKQGLLGRLWLYEGNHDEEAQRRELSLHERTIEENVRNTEKDEEVM